MTRTLMIAITSLALTATGALACSPEDALERQEPLLVAMQNLMAIDPAKAQAIVAKMTADMDAAAAVNDEAAVCQILDEAIASATGG